MSDPMLFSSFTLASGLKVFHRFSDVPWFVAHMQVGIGHGDDPQGKEGLAHLVEHQLNSGTEGLPRMQLMEFREWLEDRRFDFEHGSTSGDHTEYAGRTEIEKAEAFFRFFHAFLRRPLLEGTIEHDRAIIRAERIDRTSPRRTQHGRAIAKAIYGDHPLATRTGLPEDDVLNGLTQEDVRATYRRFYQYPNMTLVVVGGITEERLQSMLERIFTDASQGFVPHQRQAIFPLRSPNPKEITTHMPNDSKVTSAEITHLWIMPPTRSRASVIVRHCLGRILNDRIREKERLAYGVQVETASWQDRESLYVRTEIDPTNLDRVRAIITETMRDREAVLATFERVRRNIACAISRSDQTIDAKVASAASDIRSYGRPMLLREIVNEFDSLTKEQAAEYLASLDPSRAFIHTFEL